MFYVYLLKDLNNKIYIGYSGNLRKRILEHKKGKVYTTKRMEKPDLFYYEAYNSELAAKTREKKLKQFGSSYKDLVKRIIGL